MGTLFYAGDGISFLDLRFENDVKQYGTQANLLILKANLLFENDVKQYGTQAMLADEIFCNVFENDVKQYGPQADLSYVEN